MVFWSSNVRVSSFEIARFQFARDRVLGDSQIRVDHASFAAVEVFDALRVLDAEGVVTIHLRAGIQFVRPGLEMTRSTYQFRGILETAAVAVFAEIGGGDYAPR